MELLPDLLERSKEFQGGLGAIAFATLEMFRRGGMDPASIDALRRQMNACFARPTEAECNAICRMVETRLAADRLGPDGPWYE